ncbi:hypothetical protein [Pedobacter jamesrossensis]|uniref:Uncharacterized protein n=1 Tax=Pedobacter jamesrossensis TaxID=1908238 RepID=A0ABV8NGE9_9SPHI
MTLKLSFFFILLLIKGITFAQLNGSYSHSFGVDAGTRTLTFEGQNFTDERTGHMNGIHGAGSFKLENSNLFLNYHLIKNNDSSLYKIDSKLSYSKYTKIFVKVFDEKIEMNGCSVALRDQDFNIILYTTTLNDGSTSLSVNKIEGVQYLTIDFIGYNQVVIPYRRLLGMENDIFVNFKPQKTVIIPAQVDILKIIKCDDKGVTLRKSNGEELLFIKSK